MQMQEFSDLIGTLVSQNKIDQAIREIGRILNGSPKLKELIIHSARYSELKEQIRKGTVSVETGRVTKNQIMLALLELTEEISEMTKSDPYLEEEVQRALTQGTQQRGFQQYHYGKGDNVGGDKNVYKS